MRVGINGMGRMGRLALRAALGGVRRADGDPRAANRLDVVHLNEVKGGAAATAHLLEFDSIHGRWHASFGVEDDSAIRIDNRSLGFSAGGEARRRRLGRSRLRHRAGMHRQVPEAGRAQPYFDRGVKRVIVAAPVKDDSALNIVVGVNDRLYDPERHRLLTAASCTTNCLAPVVKVDPRGDRHRARPDHHHPRSDQHQRRGRRAAQGPAARPLGHDVAAADDDGQRHRHRADLSRTQGQAERPRGARAGAQCQPHRLRVRAQAPDDRGRGQRPVRGRGARAAGRHPGLRDAAAGLGRLLQRHPQLDRRRPEHAWSPTARCSRSMRGTTTRSAMSAAWSISPTW